MCNNNVVRVMDLVVYLSGVQHCSTMINWNICRALMQGLRYWMRHLLGTIRYWVKPIQRYSLDWLGPLIKHIVATVKQLIWWIPLRLHKIVVRCALALELLIFYSCCNFLNGLITCKTPIANLIIVSQKWLLNIGGLIVIYVFYECIVFVDLVLKILRCLKLRWYLVDYQILNKFLLTRRLISVVDWRLNLSIYLWLGYHLLLLHRISLWGRMFHAAIASILSNYLIFLNELNSS